jgi:hypothetical protein
MEIIITVSVFFTLIALYFIYTLIINSKNAKESLDVSFNTTGENDIDKLKNNTKVEEKNNIIKNIYTEQNNLIAEFKIHLIKEGKSEKTPTGKPSTVYDYSNRVNTVAKREGITLRELGNSITDYVEKYDNGGTEEDFGNNSNRAVINALKQFKKFIENKKNYLIPTENKEVGKTNNPEINEDNLVPNDTRNNFIVSQNMLDKGYVIKVTFRNGGTHDGESYIYDHDKLVEACRVHLHQNPTWNNAGNYTNSNNIPRWAMITGLIKKIK